MLIKINNKKRNSNSLLLYCFYLMDLVKEHKLTGRLINVVIKDKSLISKWNIKYSTMVETCKELEVLSKPKREYENIPYSRKAYMYRINKSKLLITCLMCIGINSFDSNTIKKVSKHGFDFKTVLNGIDSSIKDSSKGLFSTRNEYESKIATYVYESLQALVNYEQIHITDYTWQKTSILRFFENLNTGTSHYYSITGNGNVLPIPSTSLLLKCNLVEAMSHSILPIPSISTSSYSSTLTSSSSSSLSSFLQFLHKGFLYLDKLTKLMSLSLLTHRGYFQYE